MNDNCFFCGGLCNEIYNFGLQPHSTGFASEHKTTLQSLTLEYCEQCDLYQTGRGSRTFLFEESYQKHSSVSKGYQTVLRDQYNALTLSKDAVITEIGCNDGMLLAALHKIGFKNLFGFEVVPHLANKAVLNSEAKVVAEPFNLSTFGRVPRSDLVICNHTFHQIEKLNEFVEALRLLVKPNGKLIIEVPDFEAIVKNNTWDLIAHENRSYFTQSSMLNIMGKYFAIENVMEMELPVPSKRYTFLPKLIPDYNVKKEKVELDLGTFKRIIPFSKLSYLETLIQWKKLHRMEIAVFGACSKGNSFLNYLGIDHDVISYCVDETPGKCGKRLPKSNIPVISLEAYRELTKKPDVMLITAWNYQREIKEKVNHSACWVKTQHGEFKRV